MKTQSLTPLRQQRLNDLITLSNHDDRQQWHGLRCHHIPRGQFTATYAHLARRWGVSPSVVYATIKALVKLGYITTRRLDFCTLITIVGSPTPKDTNVIKDHRATKATKATKATNVPNSPKAPQKHKSIKPAPRPNPQRLPYLRPKIQNFQCRHRRYIKVRCHPRKNIRRQ